MSEQMTGACACGKVRYSVPIDSDEAYLCHCRMCQRATGSISIAFKNVRKADIAWDGAPDWYKSSAIANRAFCAACGASLGFAYPDSKKMDLTVASFDDPSRFRPTAHFGAESMHRLWLNTEGLPETRSEEYQPLVDLWAKAAGGTPG
jgi:hypothetical protein